jgi:hypothetical protein
MVSNILEAPKVSNKGTLPVIALPTVRGSGWDELKLSRYEVEDIIVKAEDIKVYDTTGRVEIKGYDRDFRLTPFSATGFAWCSLTEDRKCEDDDAGTKITEGFRKQAQKEYLLRILPDGTIITILSPNFFPMKNSEVIDGVLTLQKHGMESIDSFEMSPYKLNIAMRSKKKFKLGPESAHAGVAISTGEHGKAAFEMHMRILQLICMNGATIQVGESADIRRKHNLRDTGWNDFDIVTEAEKIVNSCMGTSGVVEHLETLTLREEKVKQDTFKRVIAIGEFGPRHAEAFLKSYDAQRELRGRTKGESMYDVYNSVTGLHNAFPKNTLNWEAFGGRLLLAPEDFYAGN